MASGITNGNSLLVTALGTFDYLKNFLVIFIYAAFFRDFNGFKKLFRLLLFIAILLGTVALIQFTWAMGSVYISGKNISDQSAYILFSMPKDNIEIAWRYGIFRAPSLTYHAYILGLFNLLIFTIYFYTAKRANIKICISLVSGVIVSVSRMAYGGLIFIMSIQIFKRRKWFILLLLVISLTLITNINFSGDHDIRSILNLSGPADKVNLAHKNIRLDSLYKSIEIWKDYPYWGVGPGFFGGIVASKCNSYIYEQYNVSNLSYINRFGGIELFWLQILVEMGVIGALLFINLIVILYITLYKLREQAMSRDMKNLFSALIVFIPCILIYTIGSGINIAPVLFTYCAFVGMGLGCIGNRRED